MSEVSTQHRSTDLFYVNVYRFGYKHLESTSTHVPCVCPHGHICNYTQGWRVDVFTEPVPGARPAASSYEVSRSFDYHPQAADSHLCLRSSPAPALQPRLGTCPRDSLTWTSTDSFQPNFCSPEHITAFPWSLLLLTSGPHLREWQKPGALPWVPPLPHSPQCLSLSSADSTSWISLSSSHFLRSPLSPL